MAREIRIGDEVWVHGFVDEIRKDVIIIRNEGGYFGTVAEEIGYCDDYEGLTETSQTNCDKCIWNVCNYNSIDWDAPFKGLADDDDGTLPQTERPSCETCRYGQDKHRYAHICNECGVGIDNYTPQTDCGWKEDR